jgi:hypothetical protein
MAATIVKHHCATPTLYTLLFMFSDQRLRNGSTVQFKQQRIALLQLDTGVKAAL